MRVYVRVMYAQRPKIAIYTYAKRKTFQSSGGHIFLKQNTTDETRVYLTRNQYELAAESG